jgi:hypothetical protein
MAVDPQVQDQVAIALSRLATQFKESPNLKGYISALLVEANNIERVLWQLINDRYIDTAYGVQLDILGELVGQSRTLIDSGLFYYFGFDGTVQANPFGSWQDGLTSGGRFAYVGEPTVGTRELTDPEYRDFIRMKVINNITRSTPEGIIQTFSFLFGGTTPIALTEGPGTQYNIQIGRELTLNEKVLLENFPIPKTAGVTVNYYSTFVGASPFGFSGVPGSLGLGYLDGGVAVGGGTFATLL